MGRDRALWVLGAVSVALVVAAGFVLAALRTDELPTYGPSMAPTLTGSDPVRIDFDAYAERAPALGDVIVFQGPVGFRYERCGVDHPPGSPCPRAPAGYESGRLLKRIIGLPGDRIAISAEGYVIRNGELVREPFVRPCLSRCGLPVAITVPDGHYFVAGDNRRASSDSRFWGAIPAAAVDGEVLLED